MFTWLNLSNRLNIFFNVWKCKRSIQSCEQKIRQCGHHKNPILHIRIYRKYAFKCKFHSYSISFVISLMRLSLLFVIFLMKLFFLFLLVLFSLIIVSGATSVTFRNYTEPPLLKSWIRPWINRYMYRCIDVYSIHENWQFSPIATKVI